MQLRQLDGEVSIATKFCKGKHHAEYMWQRWGNFQKVHIDSVFLTVWNIRFGNILTNLYRVWRQTSANWSCLASTEGILLLQDIFPPWVRINVGRKSYASYTTIRTSLCIRPLSSLTSVLGSIDVHALVHATINTAAFQGIMISMNDTLCTRDTLHSEKQPIYIYLIQTSLTHITTPRDNDKVWLAKRSLLGVSSCVRWDAVGGDLVYCTVAPWHWCHMSWQHAGRIRVPVLQSLRRHLRPLFNANQFQQIILCNVHTTAHEDFDPFKISLWI